MKIGGQGQKHIYTKQINLDVKVNTQKIIIVM